VVACRVVVSSALKLKVRVPTVTVKLVAVGTPSGEMGIGWAPNVNDAAGTRPVTPEFVFKLTATEPTCSGVSVFCVVLPAMQPPALVHPGEVPFTVTLPPGATPNVNDPLAATA
jgi:hypothetical protein